MSMQQGRVAWGPFKSLGVWQVYGVFEPRARDGSVPDDISGLSSMVTIIEATRKFIKYIRKRDIPLTKTVNGWVKNTSSEEERDEIRFGLVVHERPGVWRVWIESNQYIVSTSRTYSTHVRLFSRDCFG
jgi:hypothetical protein